MPGVVAAVRCRGRAGAPSASQGRRGTLVDHAVDALRCGRGAGAGVAERSSHVLAQRGTAAGAPARRDRILPTGFRGRGVPRHLRGRTQDRRGCAGPRRALRRLHLAQSHSGSRHPRGDRAEDRIAARRRHDVPGARDRRLRERRLRLPAACGPKRARRRWPAFLLTQESCSGTQTTLAVAPARGGALQGARPARALAYGAAFDGTRVFWFRAQGLRLSLEEQAEYRGVRVPCAELRAACRIVVSEMLPFAPASARR